MYKIVFDDGQEFAISGFGVIGRNPDISNFGSGATQYILIDPSKTVSKTHAALAVSPQNELLIEDLESTNGTFFESEGSFEQQVTNGSPQVLGNGTRVRLGDVYFTVVHFN